MTKDNRACFYPQTYPDNFCDTLNCRNTATWFIGRPDPPESMRCSQRVCEQCARDILSRLPEPLTHFLDLNNLPIELLCDMEFLKNIPSELLTAILKLVPEHELKHELETRKSK
jgi:hypothetical protein